VGRFPILCRALESGISIGEAGEVVQRTGDEFSSTGVLSFRRGGKQLDKIPSFGYRLGPRCRGADEKRILQFFLTISQRGLIGLNLVKIPADFGIFLRGHSAVLVKIDRRVRHRRIAFSPDPGRRRGFKRRRGSATLD
jgi:hypothetical protein